MAERVVYPAMFIKTNKRDGDRNEIVEYEGESPSQPGGAPARVSGRCADAEDPIFYQPYDTTRPGFVIQPEIGAGHCFQEEQPDKSDVLQHILDSGDPYNRKKLSIENRAYLESRYPRREPVPSDEDPPAIRMRLHFQDGSSDDIPCNENAEISQRDQSALENAVRIEISLGVTAIGVATFAYCSGLVEITLPEGVTRIGDSAFDECTSLAEITLPTTVTTIEASAFSACDEFDTIVLPDGVTTIGRNAFGNCTSLAEINIPEGVTRIQDLVFYNCIALRSITLPTTVTSIGFRAFEGCTNLAKINIPEGVTEIKSMAFRNCTSLKSIIFPSSVATYGEIILNGCTSLERVYLANDSGQQDVDVANLGVDPAVTIYRNFSFDEADEEELIRLRGPLYDWTSGKL